MRRKDSYLGHCLFRFMDVQMVWTWLVHKYKFVVKVQPKHKLYKRTQVHIFPTTLEPTKSNNKMSQRKERNGSFFESVFTLLANKRSTIGMDFGTTTASRRTITQDTRNVRMSPFDYAQSLHIHAVLCVLEYFIIA